MTFCIYDLGIVEFQESWSFQKQTFLKVKNNIISSALILCSHNPVITLGRNADRKNILLEDTELKKRNIPVFNIERGGDVTYHGPGQLTVYPVFNLGIIKKDIHWFLRKMEYLIISLLKDFGIPAQQRKNLTGVWVKNAKIASIGIAIRNWITFHGFSLNVKKADLENYRYIRPCGMDIPMTSLESVLSREVEIGEVKEKVLQTFSTCALD